MLRRVIILLLLAVLMVVTIACGVNFNLNGVGVTRGSGNLQTEERQVSGFSRITLNGIGELRITQGNREALTIEAEDNILPKLISEVRGDTLVLGFDETNWSISIIPTETITFTLQVKDLNGLEINGAANTHIASLETENLDLEINGLGEIVIENLTAENLAITISGGGRCDLSGVAANQTIEVNGAGSLDAEDLETQHTSVKIAGAGQATLWAKDTLDIEISGTGNVEYYGDPSVTQNITGAGSINSRGEK